MTVSEAAPFFKLSKKTLERHAACCLGGRHFGRRWLLDGEKVKKVAADPQGFPCEPKRAKVDRRRFEENFPGAMQDDE